MERPKKAKKIQQAALAEGRIVSDANALAAVREKEKAAVEKSLAEKAASAGAGAVRKAGKEKAKRAVGLAADIDEAVGTDKGMDQKKREKLEAQAAEKTQALGNAISGAVGAVGGFTTALSSMDFSSPQAAMASLTALSFALSQAQTA